MTAVIGKANSHVGFVESDYAELDVKENMLQRTFNDQFLTYTWNALW